MTATHSRMWRRRSRVRAETCCRRFRVLEDVVGPDVPPDCKEVSEAGVSKRCGGRRSLPRAKDAHRTKIRFPGLCLTPNEDLGRPGVSKRQGDRVNTPGASSYAPARNLA